MRLIWIGLAGTSAVMMVAGAAVAGKGPVAVSPMVFVPPIVFIPQSVLPGLQGASSANSATTDAIVGSLELAGRFCAAIGRDAYAVDCLAERMAAIAEAMPDGGDYAAAKAAIANAATRLTRLARDNASSDLPRIRATQGETRTTRPLLPIDLANQAAVNAAAVSILEETATLLLRSADIPVEAREDYVQIAAAVDSNKVLLRSL